MKLNADFSKRVAVHFDDVPWVPSPASGVERKMLDRIGGEVARATTIVRFAPGSAFDAHTHGGGEEYLVLDGVFQDESGDFPVGSYVRNPPTSRHTPAAAQGATILVKLHQFHPDDRTFVTIDTSEQLGDDVALFGDENETVRVMKIAAQDVFDVNASGGGELFVIDGEFTEGDEVFRRWDWLRSPPRTQIRGRAGDSGATLWVKTGHLAGLV